MNNKLILVFVVILMLNLNSAHGQIFRPTDPYNTGNQNGKSPYSGPPFLHFASTSQNYHIDHSRYNNFMSAVANAFNSWNNAGSVSFSSSSSNGVALSGEAESFDDGPGWANVSFNSSTYNINTSGSSITLNTNYEWSNTQDLDNHILDVESIVVHEAGHIHGLAHPLTSSYSHDASAPTMAGGDNAYFHNTLAARSLESADIDGTKFLQLRVPALASNLQSALNTAGQIGVGYVMLTSSVSLSSDVTVPSGATLYLDNSYLNLNSHSIASSGGTFNLIGATINGLKATLISGSTIKGLYGSAQSAIDAASSGQKVVVSSGTHSINSNLTVGSGVTLSLNSGGTVSVAAGKTITVNGELEADDVTFTKSGGSKWGGISFSSSGSGYLESCTFQYANTAITKSNGGNDVLIKYGTFQNNGSNIEGYYNNSTDLNVQNSTIKYASSEDCIYLYDSGAYLHGNTINGQYHDSDGIYVNGNWGNPEGLAIFDNNIYDCSNGIFFWDGTAMIQRNDIYSNNTGVSASYYSAPLFYESGNDGYNDITSNSIGVSNSSNSSADLDDSKSNISGNSSYNIKNYNSTTLPADNNYWGASPPNTGKIYGNVDYTPYLSSSPTSIERVSDESYVAKAAFDGEIAESGIPVQDDPAIYAMFERAVALERAKDYNAAIAEFKKVVDYNPDHTLAVSALHHLIRSSNKEDKNATASTVQEIKNTHANSQVAAWAMKYNVGELAKAGQFQDALSLSEEIVSKFSDLSVAPDALYEQWVINYILLGNKDKANSITASYEKQFGIDENLVRMKVKSGLIASEEAKNLKQQITENSKSTPALAKTQALPQEYSLSQNYPNPFNPTTTIRFALPELSAVSIKVFNVSGQLVKEIVAGDLQAGTHKIAINGSDLSSGVYLYKFSAQSRESEKSYAKINRMVLVK